MKPNIEEWIEELNDEYDMKKIYVFGDFSRYNIGTDLDRVKGITKNVVHTASAKEGVDKDFTDVIILDAIYRNAAEKNSEDVYVRCSCPDWKYRFGYFALKHSISSYDDVFNTQGRIVDAGKDEKEPTLVQTQAPRFDWTNKFDNKGPACKHVLMVLSK